MSGVFLLYLSARTISGPCPVPACRRTRAAFLAGRLFCRAFLFRAPCLALLCPLLAPGLPVGAVLIRVLALKEAYVKRGAPDIRAFLI